MGLDLQQRGGHEEKVARHVQIEAVHAGHLFEVLVGDLGDGDGADVHLLAADQVQKQVEGALETVDANLVGHDWSRAFRRRTAGT